MAHRDDAPYGGSDDRANYVLLVLLSALCLGIAVSCGKPRFVQVGEPPHEDLWQACATELDCPAQQVCVMEACVPIEELTCEDRAQPQLNVSSLSLDFGAVPHGARVSRTLTLSNTGQCVLTLFGVGTSDSNPDFDCEPCDLTAYPALLAPHQHMEVSVYYTPARLGASVGELLVRTDDPAVGDEGIVVIDLLAAYEGVPSLVLEPPELNFGYVGFDAAAPSLRTETVRVTNQGTGNATLAVQFVYVLPGSDFSVPGQLSEISPANPVLIAPYDETNPATWIDVPVTFNPTAFADHESQLTVHATGGTREASATASVRLAASSLGPPDIAVTPAQLDFVTDAGEPLALGMVGFAQVAISNLGHSELTVELGLDDASGDFSVSPSHLMPLPPGASASVGVHYAPSQPSDPDNTEDPQRPLNAYLRLVSNDADAVLTTVPLHGWAKRGLADDVLKLEMTFDNDTSSWARGDFRNVDLELLSPMGMACRKSHRTYAPGANGTFVVAATRDFCAQWSATGLEGTATWFPGNVYEEPERIALFGLGDELADGGSFTVRVHYAEDCANMPTGVLGDLLGIGTSALLGVLGGAVDVPIAVDPSSVSELVSSNCWSHAPTTATVRVIVGGVEVAAPQVTLARKGDHRDVIELRRRDGSFMVRE